MSSINSIQSQLSSSKIISSVNSVQSMKFPTFDEFRASYIRQYFSIPDSIIYYITLNPSSQNVYQKLIESCKYFFIKNSILIYHCLHFVENEWQTCIDGSCENIDLEKQKYRKIDLDLEKMQSKIWVNCKLKISSSTSTLASSLIPKLYNGNVKRLILFKQNISFKDLLFFSSTLERLYLHESIVLHLNGKIVPCEIIVANFPKLQTFIWNRKDNGLNDYSNTVNELLKISRFNHLRYFIFSGLNESFDIDKFFNYLKKKNGTKVALVFNGPLSDEYKKKLQEIADEILDAETPRNYAPPFIGFDGQLRWNELFDLCKTYF